MRNREQAPKEPFRPEYTLNSPGSGRETGGERSQDEFSARYYDSKFDDVFTAEKRSDGRFTLRHENGIGRVVSADQLQAGIDNGTYSPFSSEAVEKNEQQVVEGEQKSDVYVNYKNTPEGERYKVIKTPEEGSGVFVLQGEGSDSTISLSKEDLDERLKDESWKVESGDEAPTSAETPNKSSSETDTETADDATEESSSTESPTSNERGDTPEPTPASGGGSSSGGTPPPTSPPNPSSPDNGGNPVPGFSGENAASDSDGNESSKFGWSRKEKTPKTAEQLDKELSKIEIGFAKRTAAQLRNVGGAVMSSMSKGEKQYFKTHEERLGVALQESSRQETDATPEEKAQAVVESVQQMIDARNESLAAVMNDKAESVHTATSLYGELRYGETKWKKYTSILAGFVLKVGATAVFPVMGTATTLALGYQTGRAKVAQKAGNISEAQRVETKRQDIINEAIKPAQEKVNNLSDDTEKDKRDKANKDLVEARERAMYGKTVAELEQEVQEALKKGEPSEQNAALLAVARALSTHQRNLYSQAREAAMSARIEAVGGIEEVRSIKKKALGAAALMAAGGATLGLISHLPFPDGVPESPRWQGTADFLESLQNSDGGSTVENPNTASVGEGADSGEMTSEATADGLEGLFNIDQDIDPNKVDYEALADNPLVEFDSATGEWVRTGEVGTLTDYNELAEALGVDPDSLHISSESLSDSAEASGESVSVEDASEQLLSEYATELGNDVQAWQGPVDFMTNHLGLTYNEAMDVYNNTTVRDIMLANGDGQAISVENGYETTQANGFGLAHTGELKPETIVAIYEAAGKEIPEGLLEGGADTSGNTAPESGNVGVSNEAVDAKLDAMQEQLNSLEASVDTMNKDNLVYHLGEVGVELSEEQINALDPELMQQIASLDGSPFTMEDNTLRYNGAPLTAEFANSVVDTLQNTEGFGNVELATPEASEVTVGSLDALEDAMMERSERYSNFDFDMNKINDIVNAMEEQFDNDLVSWNGNLDISNTVSSEAIDDLIDQLNRDNLLLSATEK